MTFSVEGVLFKIPKAMLQIHSEAFASMLGFEDASGKPIVLEDPLPAFEEFCKVIFTPYEACLETAHPSSSDLEKVIGVLTLAHKYCAVDMEARAKAIAIDLTRAEVIRTHITPTLSAIQIFDTALLVDSPEMIATAKVAIIADFREKNIPPRSMLALGERHRDGKMIALAYYQIMLSGRRTWMTDETLSNKHKQDLIQLMLFCVDEWDSIAREWGSTGTIPHDHMCRSPGRVLEGAWSNNLAVPSWDVIGKLTALTGIQKVIPILCVEPLKEYAVEEVARVEALLYNLFPVADRSTL